jgi:hypothetical protein
MPTMTISRIHRATFIAGIALSAQALPGHRLHAQTVAQAGSPVTELLTKAKNALNDLNYPKADSVARQVLALGSLITADQQLAAVQIRLAAFYPEESGAQKMDSAVTVIRQMIGLGGKSVPKDISWGGLDSLVTLVKSASIPAKVVFGSKTPGAVIYVNDAAQGTLSSLRTVLVPPAVEVKLSIRAEKCASWDTTAVFRASDSVRVGIRNLKCSQ